jgi:gas vesicle protein
MSQQGNFFGGFLLGSVVGGIVGGVVGVLAASRRSASETPNAESFARVEAKTGKKRPLKPSSEQGIEVARRGLEDKIAQLNDAIDDVRQQLSTVNGTVKDPTKGKEITPDR